MHARTTRPRTFAASAVLVAAMTSGLAVPAHALVAPTGDEAGTGDAEPAPGTTSQAGPAAEPGAEQSPAPEAVVDPTPEAAPAAAEDAPAPAPVGNGLADGVDPAAADPDVTPPALDGRTQQVDGVWTYAFTADEDVVAWAYSLDSGPRTPLTETGPRTATVEMPGLRPGWHDLLVWATDAAGNEAMQYWTLDTAAPAPVVESSGTVRSELPTFQLRAVDRDVVEWSYELDGAPRTTFAPVDDERAELQLPGLAPGWHWIRFYARSAEGGVAEIYFSFFAETPMPEPTGPGIGWGGGQEDGAYVWSFGAEDEDVVRWTYSVDGGPVLPVPGATTRHADLRIEGDLEHGSHVLTVWAQNAAGEVTEIEDRFDVDVPGRAGPAIGSGGGQDETGAWVWTFGVEDEQDSVTRWTYALDGPERFDIQLADEKRAELQLVGLTGGRHVLKVWAQDASGNETLVVWTFTANSAPDTTGPLVLDTTRALEGDAWTFRYRVDETVSRWTYRLDNGTETDFTGTDDRSAVLRLRGLPPGPHDVVVTMTDLAGNSTQYRWVFDVDGAVVEPEPGPAPAPTPTAPATPTTPAPAPPSTTPAAPAVSAGAIPASRVARGIARGASGESVAVLQRLLGVAPDGRFGRQTAAAVRAFQRSHGLVADGVVGPLTWAALVDVANGGSGFTTVTAASIPQAVVLRGIRTGARGQAVVTVQRLVGAAPDGRFGVRTRLAVQAWQRAHGLVADGVVGRLTWAALSAPR